MFQFNLATIADRDIQYTISALTEFLESVAGQAHNPFFIYLLDVMKAEMDRREQSTAGGVVNIVLPFGEATCSHVWGLLGFAGGVVQAAARGTPSPAAHFFCRIIEQIEATTERMQAAVNN